MRDSREALRSLRATKHVVAGPSVRDFRVEHRRIEHATNQAFARQTPESYARQTAAEVRRQDRDRAKVSPHGSSKGSDPNARVEVRDRGSE